MSNAAAPVPRQVQLVRDALRRQFDGLIDVQDITDPRPEERDKAFLSRALAALVARDRLGCSPKEAADTVIDGRDDQGIDAVAVSDGAPRLWLVQAKWSGKGQAGFNVAEALKLIDGLRLIDQQEFSRFNPRFQAMSDRVKTALLDYQTKITLSVVLMGSQPPSADVRQRLHDACHSFNQYGEVLDVEILLASDVLALLRKSVVETPIDLAVRMDKWFHVDTPFDAYSGMVPAGVVAEWFEQHGDRLFSKNIRRSLGLTRVNAALAETLTDDPDKFWYFNNGITVLCERCEATLQSRSRHAAVELNLVDASVVNGAQTVVAAHTAMSRSAEKALEGYVGVRVITVGRNADDLALDITKATNTQNHVERRDFVALDPVQSQIKDDFSLSLGMSYAIKRGELDPPPDQGCSVVHAAIALACAHNNAELAVRAKRDPDLLWERGDKGAYDILFGKAPAAVQIWRSVRALRATQAALHNSRTSRRGRAAAVAEHCDYLATHIIFQHVGFDGIDDLDSDWENQLSEIPKLLDRAVDWLVYHLDENFGTSSILSTIFSSPEHCKILASEVVRDMARSFEPPTLPDEYREAKPVRRTRRPNTVAIVIDAHAIKEGTTLLFSHGHEKERLALASWLAAKPERARATWVDNRSKPLLWQGDGKAYSPSGLVMRMWALAKWRSAPSAVQGTARWSLQDGRSLVDLAEALLVSSGATS